MPLVTVSTSGSTPRSATFDVSSLSALDVCVKETFGAYGELRCAHSGLPVTSSADLVEPEDALVVVPEGAPASDGATDPAPSFPASFAIELVELSRLPPTAFSVIDEARSVVEAGDGGALTALIVSVRSERALTRARRFTLYVSHTLVDAAAPAAVQSTAEADDALHAEWALVAGALGVHPSIAAAYAHWIVTPPPEIRAALPPRVASALAAAPNARLSMLLTECAFPAPSGRVPFSAAFGYARDLLLGAVHLDRARVAHRAIGPLRIGVAATTAPGDESSSSFSSSSRNAPGRLVITRCSSAVCFRRAVDGAAATAARVQQLPSSGGAGVSPQSHAARRALIDLCSSADGPYVAPELHAAARALAVGASASVPCGKADVWSIAATILTMALGSHPLGGGSVGGGGGYPFADAANGSGGGSGGALNMSGDMSMSDGDVMLPPNVNLHAVPPLPPDYPPAFSRLLLWMLRPNPAQRITAQAALSRLDSLARGTPMFSSPFLFLEPGAGRTGSALRAALPSETVRPGMSAALVAALGSGTGIVRRAALGGSDDGEETEEERAAEGGGEMMETEAEEGGGKAGGDRAAPKGGWVAVVSGAAAADASRSGGHAGDPVCIAAVPFTEADSETVAAIIARASELLDLRTASGGGSSSSSAASAQSVLALPALYDAFGHRIDALAPFHRLPDRLRTGGALRLVPASDAPDEASIFVEGFGCAVPPAPPDRMPTTFLPFAAAGSVAASAVTALPVGQPQALPAVSAGVVSSSTGPHAGAVVWPPGLAPPPSAPIVRGEDHLQPGYSFSPHHKSDSLQLSDGSTVVSTRQQWGSVLLSQGRLGLPGTSISGVQLPPDAPPLATRFAVAFTILQMDAGAGVAIGIVDPERFDPRRHVFGNTPGSWGYSRTGKISDGSAQWIEYGEGFAVGDVVQLEIVIASPYDVKGERLSRDSTRLRFFKNGVMQGTAFGATDLYGEHLDRAFLTTFVPAICLGSAQGGKMVRVAVSHPEVFEFDIEKRHHRIQFSEDNCTVSNNGKWATTLAAHPGIRTGKLVWSVRLDDTRHGAGVAVGVVDATSFHWEKQNLGASTHSWCYSKTGKKGDGTGFHEYGKLYSNGDTITLTLDMDACTLRFAVNGDDQGVAYGEKDGIGKVPLVPAVCLGSTEGTKLAKVSIVGAYPLLRRFNRFACSKKVTLKDLYQVAETNDKWGTVFLEHPGLRTGRYSFGVTIASAGAGCGVGVGFADLYTFDPLTRNLGAAAGSWCFSKTGKVSLGTKFEPYGQQFKTNDTVTAEVDMDAEIMRFFINGKPQGDKRVEGISKDKLLVPAVVLGSGDGGHYTKLTIGLPTVSRFDPRRMHKSMVLRDEDKQAYSDQRWCSVLADHPGVMSPHVLRFAVRLEGDGGSAVGFAEASSFRPYAQNLGASPFTWAISRTGKVSCGDAQNFQPFSEKFAANDVIGAEADLNEGIIRFWKNGVLLGTAFNSIFSTADRNLTLVPAVCLGSNTGGKQSSATLVDFPETWAAT